MSPRHSARPPSRQVVLARHLFSGAFFATLLSCLIVLLRWWRGHLGGAVAMTVIALTIRGGLLSLTSGIVLIFRDTGGADRRFRAARPPPNAPQ